MTVGCCAAAYALIMVLAEKRIFLYNRKNPPYSIRTSVNTLSGLCLEAPWGKEKCFVPFGKPSASF